MEYGLSNGLVIKLIIFLRHDVFVRSVSRVLCADNIKVTDYLMDFCETAILMPCYADKKRRPCTNRLTL